MIKCNLINLMDLKNINFSNLSKETGISRQALTSLAKNESTGIQFSTLDTLLKFFNIPIGDFFTQTGMDFKIHLNYPYSSKTDFVEIVVVYKENRIVIPYSIDFYRNKEDKLEIIEFTVDYSNEYINKFKDNFNVTEPLFTLMLKITQDRFNEFGAFLLEQLLQKLKETYTFDTEMRVMFDLEYEKRVAWVSLDENKQPIRYERSELLTLDNEIFLIGFDY